jgi:hypothetical protein
LGEHAEEGGAGLGRELALMRGSAVHLLLERLADLPPGDRAVLAGRLIGLRFPELGADLAAAAVAEALAVLEAPFAGEIFGPNSLAEAGMALDLPWLSGPSGCWWWTSRPMRSRPPRQVPFLRGICASLAATGLDWRRFTRNALWRQRFCGPQGRF